MNLMSNSTLLFSIMGGIVLILGLVLAISGMSTWVKKDSKVSTRLDLYVASETPIPGKKINGQIIPREVTGSLLSRTIITWENIPRSI